MDSTFYFEIFLSTVIVLSAIYVSLSKDLLRISVAFFLQFFSVSVFLATFHVEYLAFVVFGIGVLGTILIISFSSFVVGNLKLGLRDQDVSKENKFTKFVGVFLGLSLGSLLGFLLMKAPVLVARIDQTTVAVTEVKSVNVHHLGEMLALHRVPIFQMIAVMCLVVVVGSGLLLRKPKDAS